jgi:hypothetical protein
MAHICVYDFTGIGLDFGNHTATSYIIAKDQELKLIIDQSLNNTEDKTIWHSMLPKRVEDDGGSGYYGNCEELWAGVKIHMGDISSPWMTMKLPINQKKQDYVITEDGQSDKFKTSSDLGITV